MKNLQTYPDLQMKTSNTKFLYQERSSGNQETAGESAKQKELAEEMKKLQEEMDLLKTQIEAEHENSVMQEISSLLDKNKPLSEKLKLIEQIGNKFSINAEIDTMTGDTIVDSEPVLRYLTRIAGSKRIVEIIEIEREEIHGNIFSLKVREIREKRQ